MPHRFTASATIAQTWLPETVIDEDVEQQQPHPPPRTRDQHRWFAVDTATDTLDSLENERK